ncbi:hypothetical protein SAMN05444166_6843 [Singulisphaera sp. GP187]|uniref:DUF6931 family protein n=1 Tax=Singulisphaera sp. GP187 TaxID=1882752 RepID=UPI000929B82D|nr:hypothetical protein [Singulisphaera sp. GP187]SIO61744.1 hypothetical protein SAMN05444166_6843 [Singulisphaera sp. GP187]
MSEESLIHLVEQTPRELCQTIELSAASRELLRNEPTAKQFLSLLVEKQEFPDAARFWAHALPKREAVWWACVCARIVMAEGAPLPQHAALEAAEAWCTDPTEENRRKTMPASDAAGLGTPAGCAAAAAFWSGGSLAPPDVPVVPPGEELTAHGVAGSVMLAAVRSEPEKAPEKYKRFFERGVGVAEGTQRWSEPVVPAATAPRKATPDDRSSTPTSRPAINWD